MLWAWNRPQALLWRTIHKQTTNHQHTFKGCSSLHSFDLKFTHLHATSTLEFFYFFFTCLCCSFVFGKALNCPLGNGLYPPCLVLSFVSRMLHKSVNKALPPHSTLPELAVIHSIQWFTNTGLS